MSRLAKLLPVLVLAMVTVGTGCTSTSSPDFGVEEWSREILDCVGTLESQYPGADRARMWVVCEDEFWSDKQGLLNDLCMNDPDFASCDFRK
jgi:hypothetical protein